MICLSVEAFRTPTTMVHCNHAFFNDFIGNLDHNSVTRQCERLNTLYFFKENAHVIKDWDFLRLKKHYDGWINLESQAGRTTTTTTSAKSPISTRDKIQQSIVEH